MGIVITCSIEYLLWFVLYRLFVFLSDEDNSSCSDSSISCVDSSDNWEPSESDSGESSSSDAKTNPCPTTAPPIFPQAVNSTTATGTTLAASTNTTAHVTVATTTFQEGMDIYLQIILSGDTIQ